MTKEDIKQICQIYDNFRSERDAATIAYNSDDTFWEHILATYNLSQPSLPSNLDEAAEKEYDNTIDDLHDVWINAEGEDVTFDQIEDIARQFFELGKKAGAK